MYLPSACRHVFNINLRINTEYLVLVVEALHIFGMEGVESFL